MARSKQTVDVEGSHALVPSELPAFVSRLVAQARRYYLDLSEGRPAGIRVACGGCERVHPEYLVQRATFPHLVIEFVAEGQGKLTLCGTEYQLAPGAIFVYGPGIPHTIITDPRHVMLKYYVGFVGRAAEKLLPSHGLAPGQFARVSLPHEIRHLFELLQQYGMSTLRSNKILCASLIPTLIHLIEELNETHETSDPRPLATFEQLKRLMDDHFLDLHTAEQAATRCGISVAYACRLFKRFERVTPYQYLMEQKMRRAADMLSDTDILVKHVAKRLGFANQYHFSRAFKRVFGLSPHQLQQHLSPQRCN